MHEAIDIPIDSRKCIDSGKCMENRQERKVCYKVPNTRLKCQEALYVVYMQTIAMGARNSKLQAQLMVSCSDKM